MGEVGPCTNVVWSPGFVHRRVRNPTGTRLSNEMEGGNGKPRSLARLWGLYETRWDLPVAVSPSADQVDRDATGQCRIGNQQGDVGGKGIGAFGPEHG